MRPSLEGIKYEKEDLGKSLQRVLKYHSLRGKFVGAHAKLQKNLGIGKFQIDFNNEYLRMISTLKVCKDGDNEAFKLLLSGGANPNEENYLHAAIRGLSLCKGSSLNKEKNHHTVIKDSEKIGEYFDIIKALIAYKADVNRKNEKGETPIRLAAAKGQLDVVEFLLKNGATDDKNSLAPLVFVASCQNNDIKTVKDCLALSVDVNTISNDGKGSG